MAEQPHDSAGVMDGAYAHDRLAKKHLRFRYRVRARLAARAYRAAAGRAAPAVLDLGAAEGLTLLELRRLLGPDGTYHGVELSSALIGAAPSLPDNVTLLEGDVQALPDAVDAGRYDLVTALAVLEHLPDALACVREAHRALRPGGVFVATAPQPIWDELAGRLGMVADEHHEDHLTGRKLRRLARDAGFPTVRFSRFMFAPIGVLPYAGVDFPPGLALRIDEALHGLRVFAPAFVNQALVAVKP